MSAPKQQSKYWVFTINNPIDDQIPARFADTEYVVWQREKGANGTEHLQGYVIFTKSKRLTGVKKIHGSAHWESRMGTHAQAKEYVTKTATRVGGPWEEGDEPADKEQGKRNDLLTLKRKLDEGKSESEIARDPETFPVWAKHYKVVARYKTLTGQQRNWPTFTQVIWGAPGLGKTRKALELAGPDAYWLPRPAGQTAWFDNYIGQETIVIDEFYGWLPLDLLCRLLDRYPMQVETKGGSTMMLARKVIITSNVPPAQWYKLPPERLNALFRRLSMPLGTIEHMLVPYVPAQGPATPLAPIPEDSPLDAQAQRLLSDAMQAGLECSEDLPLSISQLGGDHLEVDSDPLAWLDVEPYYGAQR